MICCHQVVQQHLLLAELHPAIVDLPHPSRAAIKPILPLWASRSANINGNHR